jgi:hypothetical protein
MRWVWKLEPLDPATTTPEQLVAEKQIHDRGRAAGALAGIRTAGVVYLLWERLDGTQKWVDYSRYPAIVVSGCVLYRIVYEIVIRFRP